MKHKNTAAMTAQDKEFAFSKMPVPQALAKFMIPTVLSQLAFMILNLADAFFVGQTGDTYQVSAMTITFPVIMMMNVVTTVFATGGNSCIAAALGNGDRARAEKTSVFCIYTSIAIAVLYSFLVLAFRTPIFRLLGASDNSIGFCRDYMFWALAMSSIPFTFNQVISQLFLAEGETRIAGFGIAMAGVINIILDPIFVFALDMGVAGVGAATCISNFLAFIYYLYHHRKRRQGSVVKLDIRLYSFSGGAGSKVLAVGIASGLVLLLVNIVDFIRNYYLGSLGGDYELAAWGAVQKISNAMMIITTGIAQGARPLLAYNYANGSFRRTRALFKGAFVVMVVYIAAALTLVHIFPEAIVKLFVTHQRAVEIAVFFLEIWTFAIIGIGLLELLNATYQAFGKWKLSLANTIINKGFMLPPTLIILVNCFGINGIPYSQIITENLTVAVLLVITARMMKKELKDE